MKSMQTLMVFKMTVHIALSLMAILMIMVLLCLNNIFAGICVNHAERGCSSGGKAWMPMYLEEFKFL